MRLQGRSVVVTGAAGAIGQETARHLLKAGASRLLLTDLPRSGVDAVAETLRDGHFEIASAEIDVADPAAFVDVLAEHQAFLGSIDVLVNVAGYWQIIDFVASDADQWDLMIRANLLTAISACHSVLPQMLTQGRGSIVNFASTAGEYGSIRPSAAYAAAKGGVIAFTKSLAREVSPRGVRVNAISPGPIDTPALKAASDEARAGAAARTLVGRLGLPADIASGVVYLASDESSFMTGAVLAVNGGSLL